MAYASYNSTSGFSFSEKLREQAAAWRIARAKRAAFRQTRDELQTLSDRELADIGVARADIDHLAREFAETAA